jgi:hypothetical protein
VPLRSANSVAQAESPSCRRDRLRNRSQKTSATGPPTLGKMGAPPPLRPENEKVGTGRPTGRASPKKLEKATC